ncbi:MAG: hypothetical protein M5Z89_15815, partial [Olivibacter sp.]|nr:hypothetical protein [Olivibacter sp. UJ_SKK_5.1]
HWLIITLANYFSYQQSVFRYKGRQQKIPAYRQAGIIHHLFTSAFSRTSASHYHIGSSSHWLIITLTR